MNKLSVDIGLKNLALCIMSCEDQKNIETFSIKLWDVFDIIGDEKELCSSVLKNGKTCKNKCLYKHELNKDVIYCCKKHFPKGKKITLRNRVKIKKVSDYLLQEIVKIFLEKFQKIYENDIEIFHDVCEIYIELQPKCNPRMKLISHVLFGKLVELYPNETKIRFVSASKKLKAYKGPFIECKLKSKYSQRKWLSIEYCKWFINEKFSEEEREKWLPKVLKKGKTDDMSDTFLMCINSLYKA